MKARRLLATLLLPALGLGAALRAQERVPIALAREILADLVNTDTTAEHGDTTPAVAALARRFLAAGFPAEDVQVLGPAAAHRNLVVRYRGRGQGRPGGARPILFLDHLDVVEALRSDWTRDPFRLTEEDGWLYGRGTQDIKGEAALQVATFLHLKRAGFVPKRDLILALTTGEEGGTPYSGVAWLLKEHRALVDAEFCLNGDGGGPVAKAGVPRFRALQASEKASRMLELTVTDAGGHSSLPTRNNPIHILAAGLARLDAAPFPVHLDEARRTFFERMAKVQGGETGTDMAAVAREGRDGTAADRLSADPYWNAQLRTTAVATQIQGGHAPNALPQTAKALVNCRILPGETLDAVKAHIVKTLADPRIRAEWRGHEEAAPASPLRPDVVAALEASTQAVWPGCPVIPTLETGGTDGTAFRLAGIPTYGVGCIPVDQDDVRAHGRDERIRIRNFEEGLRAFEGLVRALAE